MLVHMCQAKRVLEIGMFTGYGALSMAEGLPEDGCLVACELEPYLRDFSRPLFDKSPHGRKIRVRTGSAMDTLRVRGFFGHETGWEGLGEQQVPPADADNTWLGLQSLW